MRYVRRAFLLGSLIVSTVLACRSFGSTTPDEPSDASAPGDAKPADRDGNVDDAGPGRGVPPGCEACAQGGQACCVRDRGARCTQAASCVLDGGFTWACGVTRDCDSGECCGRTSGGKAESTSCLDGCNGLGNQLTMCEPGGEGCRAGTSCKAFAGAPASLGLFACQ